MNLPGAGGTEKGDWPRDVRHLWLPLPDPEKLTYRKLVRARPQTGRVLGWGAQ